MRSLRPHRPCFDIPDLVHYPMKVSAYLGIALLFVSVMGLGFIVPTAPQDHKTEKPGGTLYTYHKDILPMLQANCNPCHFPGGKVYKKLPFDDSVTVAKLGKKLNTRLKQKEQQTIINGWVESKQKSGK